MPKFRIGDRVIGNAGARRYGITKTGWKGIVLTYPWDPRAIGLGEFCATGVKGSEYTNHPFVLEEKHFDLLTSVNIDLTRPIKQRCGRPVISWAQEKGVEERPIVAFIMMADRSIRTMSYPLTGFFYKEIESDIDLVNV